MSEESIIRQTHLCATVEWEIKNFFSQQPLFLRSPVFLLSDAEWCLKYAVPPSCGLEFMSLGIQRIFSRPEEHHIIFTIMIKELDGRMFWSFRRYHTFTESFKTSEIHLSRSELLKYRDNVVPDDVLTVHCEFHDMQSQMLGRDFSEKLSKFKLHIPEGAKNLLENFKDLFANGLHPDVVVKIGSQEFPVHRSILAARCPVFAAMFNYETVEKQSGIVNIVDFDPDLFKSFLSFLYTGDMNVVNSSNAIELYKAADKYNISDLKKECVRFMAEDLSIESVCDVILLAVVQDESQLLEVANNFFVENIKTILPATQWVSFLSQHSSLANELLINLINEKF